MTKQDNAQFLIETGYSYFDSKSLSAYHAHVEERRVNSEVKKIMSGNISVSLY